MGFADAYFTMQFAKRRLEMGFNDYQEGLEKAAERQYLVDEYIDDHDLLKSSSAWESSFDNNEDALREIWRIVQTRPANESDFAIADIRSVMNQVIQAAAERFADTVIRNRELNFTVYES